MRSMFGLVLAVLMVTASHPALAATFTLQCHVDGEEHDYTFLFDTRKSEVLSRRPGQGADLAKYQKIEITLAQVTFARYGMMGSATRKYRTARAGGAMYESRKKGSWSDWKQVGHCWKP